MFLFEIRICENIIYIYFLISSSDVIEKIIFNESVFKLTIRECKSNLYNLRIDRGQMGN